MDELKERIDLINIEDEMQRAYIDYSMSVIVGRALPDARGWIKAWKPKNLICNERARMDAQ